MSSAPTSIDEACHAMAASSPVPIRIAGAGTKRLTPRDDVPALDLRQLSGIVTYDPAECVVTALAGTPVAEVESALAAHGQYLPFDPPLAVEGATMGGMVAAGWNGSCRYRYGGVRDFVIGARVVDGRGRLIASGGQVVKNAAGFLTHHVLVGSAGRLGAIVEVSLKVFPRPEARATIAARASTLADAVDVHERVRLANLDLEALDLDGARTTVWARLAGATDALPARVEHARQVVGFPVDVLTDADDVSAWELTSMRHMTRATVVKVPATPSRLLAVLDALGPLGHCRSAVGGAVVYLLTDRDLADISAVLVHHGWRGAVVRGRDVGERVGAPADDVFFERVRRTLDPDARFR